MFCIVALTCAALTQSVRADDSGSGGDRADLWDLASTELRAVLAQKHPRVTQWSLAPQFGSAHRREFPEGQPTTVEVLRTGVRSAVRLGWLQADASQQTRSLWFEVAGEEPAVVMTRDFAPGAALQSTDATIAQRDVLQVSCSPVENVEVLEGMRARRALRAGAIVCLEAIEKRPPVGRGETVKVNYVSDRVMLATTGIAQQDGQLGQRLRVLNPSSRESFSAVVSAAAEVTVQEALRNE